MWSSKSIANNYHNSKYVDNLKSELESSRQRIAELESGVKNVKEQLSAIFDGTRDSTVIIDWKVLKAFSVERLIRDKVPCTVIGHFIDAMENGVKTAKTAEWNIYCSEAHHEKLCEEFKKHIGQ